jgi:hypothetical protein
MRQNLLVFGDKLILYFLKFEQLYFSAFRLSDLKSLKNSRFSSNYKRDGPHLSCYQLTIFDGHLHQLLVN